MEGTRVERLGWRVAEFAAALGVSRSKAYEILAANPHLTFRIGAASGSAVRVAPDRARAWIEQRLTDRMETPSR